MVSETRFVGFWPWSDNREGHFNMAPCWAGGRGGTRVASREWVRWGGSRRDQYSPNCIHESWHVFMHSSITTTSTTTNRESHISFQISSTIRVCWEASSTYSRAPIVSANAIVLIQRCRKEDALGIQAISLHWVKLFQFRIQAFVPFAQHWELETWHKQHYVL